MVEDIKRNIEKAGFSEDDALAKAEKVYSAILKEMDDEETEEDMDTLMEYRAIMRNVDTDYDEPDE